MSIARSLINEPDLLLLDEPTTGLDPQARHLLWDKLYQLKERGATLVLTTHFMDEAEQLCDRLVVMDDGKIVAEGSPATLIAQYATREVLEVRFGHGRNEERASQVEGIGERLEVLPDRLLIYARDGEAALSEVHARELRPGERIGAAQQSGGRVPPAHRTDARRVTDSLQHREAPSRTPGPVRVWFREITFYRRIWRANVLAAFVQPMLYLLGVGIGVGTLVDEGPGSTAVLGGVSYFAFDATGAAGDDGDVHRQSGSAVADDGRLHVVARVPARWCRRRSNRARSPPVLAMHHAIRTAIGATGVAVVLAAFPDTRSWGLIPAIPVATLCGMAFGLPLAAWTATRSRDISFPAILRFGIIPMFLFGGAFFPISQLPDWLQKLAWITPLWHGVELCRGLVLGGLEATDGLAHLAVLLAFVVGGWAACQVTFRRRLRP